MSGLSPSSELTEEELVKDEEKETVRDKAV